MRPCKLCRSWSCGALALAVAASFPGAALAQVPGRDDTVMTRKRPDYEPLGVRAGAFRLYPRLHLGQIYDDNVFAQERNEIDDFVTVISPGVAVRSDWNNHALNFAADTTVGRYADEDGEDYVDYSVSLDGRLDVLRSTALTARLSHGRTHEERDSPDDAGGAKPTRVHRSSASAGLRHAPGRLSLELDASVQNLDFDDVISSTGTIDNDDRDRLRMSVSARVGFEALPQREIFLRVSADDRNYDDDVDSEGFDRDSHGFGAVAGAAFELTGVTSGEVFAGYGRRLYDDSRFGSTDKPEFGGSITWTPSGLTTVTASAENTVSDTTFASASGIEETQFRLGVDHELLRNLILRLHGSVRDEDYRGVERNDDVYSVTFSTNYLMSRHLYLSFSYNYERRDSDVSGEGFSRNAFFIGLETQL